MPAPSPTLDQENPPAAWSPGPRPTPTLPKPPTSCPPLQLPSWDGCHPIGPVITLPPMTIPPQPNFTPSTVAR
ncbi:hypothetical protein [Kitasatospora sp. NPDC005751]|uniref:hypothetical protein n=1 Tax=unclassified Kitasatospora TaxID=2633591 RepID=UPI0033C17ECE